MPNGELSTQPKPVPASVFTVRLCWELNVAVTFLGAFIVTRQSPWMSTESQPDQLTNWVLAPDIPVRVTAAPWLYLREQVEPQSMPAGELVTVPEPAPPLFTVSVRWEMLKVAVTLLGAFMVTRHWLLGLTESQPD